MNRTKTVMVWIVVYMMMWSSADLFSSTIHETAKNRGTVIYPNGTKYTGDFKNNKFHGEGELIFSNGSRYRGDFLKGEFHGYGVFHYKSGLKYIGDFKDGIITSKG